MLFRIYSSFKRWIYKLIVISNLVCIEKKPKTTVLLNFTLLSLYEYILDTSNSTRSTLNSFLWPTEQCFSDRIFCLHFLRHLPTHFHTQHITHQFHVLNVPPMCPPLCGPITTTESNPCPSSPRWLQQPPADSLLQSCPLQAFSDL